VAFATLATWIIRHWVTPSEFRRDLWLQKTTILSLSYGVVCVILHLAILVQCRVVTDRQTEGHDNSVHRASISSRSENLLTKFRKSGVSAVSVFVYM